MEKYVIFDIDGTLSQTALYAAAACQKALDKGGKQVPEQEIISCIGEGFGTGKMIEKALITHPIANAEESVRRAKLFLTKGTVVDEFLACRVGAAGVSTERVPQRPGVPGGHSRKARTV